VSERIQHQLEQNPYKPGADEVRLVGYGVSVWALIAYLHAAGGDLKRTAHAYDVPLDAVQAAVDYYQTHREIIDARIAANAAAA
jgi:uncharacterized protein (DUF433 family)